MPKGRNQLILRAIIDKLGSGTEIYTAEDILLAANIESENLQEVQERLTNKILSWENIGKNIRLRRIAKRMTQEQLAKKAAVSATMISYIETGVKSISVKTLYLMSKALDCTTDDLLKENEKNAI